MNDLRNTPGIGGYALAVAVSVVATSTLVFAPLTLAALLAGATAGEEVAVMALFWGYAIVIGLAVALPFALVGVPIIHLLCRDRPSQIVHVVVTGAVSFALLMVVLGLMAGGAGTDADLVALAAAAALVGVSTMIGRASVIPLVRRRQRPARGPHAFERSNPPRCAIGRS
jgi:hypothetical protein